MKMILANNVLEDKRLYKFRSIIKDSSDPKKPDPEKWHYIERIFMHYELYFPSPIELNDPLECRPLFVAGCFNDPQYKRKYMGWAKRIMIAGGNTADPRDITTWLENLTQEQANTFAKDQTDEMRQQLQKYRICSFSSRSDNPVIWSHYADYHRGFCLIFSADNEFFGSAIKVEYQDKYPTLDVTDDDLTNSFLVKFSDWSYEKEFRLVSAEPNFQDALPVKNKKWEFSPDMLIGVIYGYRMIDTDRRLLESLCSKYPIKLQEKKAVLNEDKFLMKIIDL